MTGTSSQSVALIAAASLAVALVVAVAVTTPWRALGNMPHPTRADPTRDLSGAEIARARRFAAANNVPQLLARVVALALAVGLGFSRLGSTIAYVGGAGLPWPLRVVTATMALLSITLVATLPLNAWHEVIARRYGLSVQSWGLWAADQLRGFAVSVVFAAAGFLALVGLARVWPRWWWAAAALVGAVIVVALSFLYPLIIEPLFNKFVSLPPGALRDDLLAMGARDGLPISDVLVADASRRTTALNAYVSGFGATRRIVVYDTLLERPADEVRLVVAHELGHAADGDVTHSTILGALGAAISACLLGFFLSSDGLLHRVGIDGPGDPRGVALLLGLIAAFAAITGPAAGLVSRRIEARADVHSLNVTGDAGVFTRAMRELAITNLANPRPHPLLYVLFADHPSILERIALARSWAQLNGLPVPPDLAGQVGQ